MAVWCPSCQYKAVIGFYQNRCPQCGKTINKEDILTEDPYKPSGRGIKRKCDGDSKEFLFDQTKLDLTSIPTFSKEINE